MPELPEVEVVRRGLAEALMAHPLPQVTQVQLHHPRATRRHRDGAESFRLELLGTQLTMPSRRGKYLWIPLAGQDRALTIHLGMSGQLRLGEPGVTPDGAVARHVRAVLMTTGPSLWFIDQRTFGSLAVEELVPAPDAAHSMERVPLASAHIARDPLDPAFDLAATAKRMRRSTRGIKHVLLDQQLVSGIGNIYADEALWRAQLHFSQPSHTLTQHQGELLLQQAQDVMRQALAAGGTSFDPAYVNIDGQPGYFERSLAVYGRVDQPCDRCGTQIRRDKWANRSSFSCPVCQRAAPRQSPGRSGRRTGK